MFQEESLKVFSESEARLSDDPCISKTVLEFVPSREIKNFVKVALVESYFTRYSESALSDCHSKETGFSKLAPLKTQVALPAGDANFVSEMLTFS